MATLRNRIGHGLDGIGVGPFVRPVLRCMRDERAVLKSLWGLARRSGQIRSYLRVTTSPRLHIGASTSVLPGWLNTDISPAASETVYLDASRPFPFSNGVFDFAFCEHFVEHIEFQAAQTCFSEVFRCLKPGGIFRVATPDLKRYVELFAEVLTEEQTHYLERFAIFYKIPNLTPCLAINHIFYNWGHRHLYTSEDLIETLQRAGFGHAVHRAVGESDHEALRGIERHWEFAGREINAFETFVIEARKESPG